MARIPDRGPVADIGTGDGQLARMLLERGQEVIATEWNEGAYRRARARLGPWVRRGFGLTPLGEDERPFVVIAGMGGKLVLRILLQDRPTRYPGILVQPTNAVHLLRLAQERLQLTIADEGYIALGRRRVSWIRLAPGPPVPVDTLTAWLGPRCLLRRDPLALAEARALYARWQKIQAQAGDRLDPDVKERIYRCQQLIDGWSPSPASPPSSPPSPPRRGRNPGTG